MLKRSTQYQQVFLHETGHGYHHREAHRAPSLRVDHHSTNTLKCLSRRCQSEPIDCLVFSNIKLLIVRDKGDDSSSLDKFNHKRHKI